MNTTLNIKHAPLGKGEFMSVSGLSVLWLEISSRIVRASIFVAFSYWEELIMYRELHKCLLKKCILRTRLSVKSKSFQNPDYTRDPINECWSSLAHEQRCLPVRQLSQRSAHPGHFVAKHSLQASALENFSVRYCNYASSLPLASVW